MTAAIERTSLPQPRATSRVVRRRIPFPAPFSLRCGAILIDYITLISIVVVGTLIARLLGGGARSAGTSAETVGMVIAVVAAVLNLGVLPGLTGMTLGKWATGLRIERDNGMEIGIGRALLRHFVGYPLSFIILGIGFLVTTLTVRGRGLHDIIAGTVVVREGSLPSRR